MRLTTPEIGFAIIASFLVTAGTAMAGIAAPAAPAPLIGAGIPALAAFGWAYRRLRRRRQG